MTVNRSESGALALAILYLLDNSDDAINKFLTCCRDNGVSKQNRNIVLQDMLVKIRIAIELRDIK